MIVASVPAAHPYVASVVDSDVVTLLGDPVAQGAARPGQWWPPRLLEAGEAVPPLEWVTEDASGVDPHFWTDPARMLTVTGLGLISCVGEGIAAHLAAGLAVTATVAAAKTIHDDMRRVEATRRPRP